MTENPYATFLRARWDEIEVRELAPGELSGSGHAHGCWPHDTGEPYVCYCRLPYLRDDIAAKRKILDWHENWPVLVEQKAAPTVSQDYDVDSMTYSLSSRIHWATEREYVKQFGTAPPTSPILVMLAEPFRDHPEHPAKWGPLRLLEDR